MLGSYSISGLSIVTPEKLFEDSSIKVEKGNITGIGSKADYDIDVKGRYYCYPAIINVHDHMRGNYLPKVGPKEGTYYLNWHFWDEDLKSAPVYHEREKNPVEDLYLLSAYKNLFSGVVTVNDHFPHNINGKYIPALPIKVNQNYTLAHAVESFALDWGDGIEVEHRRAIEKNFPFIIHCAEGFDAETQSAVQTLKKLDCFDDHNVLIHCIGFSDEDIKSTQKAGATIVWCPGSNMFMFNVTCKIRKILDAHINVAIGTDATHSGSPNILEEIRFAAQTYKKMYDEELDEKILFDMTTINPAIAFRMQHQIGSIEEGKLADLLLVKPRHDDPYKAFVDIRMEDIELLTLDGKPVYGSAEFEDLFKQYEVDYTQIKVKKRNKVVVGDPAGLMARIRNAVGFKKSFDFIPIDD
ncbi:MAG: amidohydrolase family protein [Spirochaetales bacterium]|nr:amidohydrolase family protein [Spirochaetales bacterium]